MRIIKNSLAHKILAYLARAGGIPRKNLYTAFQQQVSYNHFSQITKRLINEGYLEIYREKNLNHIRMGERGRLELREKARNNPEDPAWNTTCVKPRNKQEKKRIELVAGVLGLCEGANIKTLATEKPPLQDLFETKNEEKIHNVKQALNQGVFYSTQEIRKSYSEYGGVGEEFSNWSRLIGIVIIKNKISFVYSINNKLIRWIITCEKRTVDTISNFLLQSKIIRENVCIPQKPNCIIAGKGYSMIPKLVYGRKWGNIKGEEKGIEKHRARVAKDNINAHNLSRVYGSAYYVPIERGGRDLFRVSAQLDENTKRAIFDKWLSDKNKTITVVPLETGRYPEGITLNREHIVYMPYIDLIELEYHKKQNLPKHFVIPTKTQEAVSRVMGPNILSARNLKGAQIEFSRYDKNGIPVVQPAFQKKHRKETGT